MKNNPSRLKGFVKKYGWLQAFLVGAQNVFFCTATLISPKLNTGLHYLKAFGKWPDLKNPGTLNEKLLWLKLKNMNDPLVIQCADKYRVRAYVRACGCGQYLNELYGVYDRAEDIPWNELPDRFVVKWNFGAGLNMIFTDREAFDREGMVRMLNSWGKKKVWLTHSEMQYKYAPKKLICEQFLDDGAAGSLTDYKVYCFHGEPKAILVMHDRNREINTEFFDPAWGRLENASKYQEAAVATPTPKCLTEMLDAARRLSAPFAFVRCDFYIVNDRPVFGEMTFTPAGGLYIAQTRIDGREMTDFLHVP